MFTLIEEGEGDVCPSITISEVALVAKDEHVNTLCENPAENDYKETGLNAGEAFVRLLGCTLRCGSIVCHV